MEVFVFAEYPELEPFAAGTLQVRLLDLTAADSAGMLLATSSINVAARSSRQALRLRVPADRARFAEDAYVVVSVKDDKGVRFIGSGFPRELTRLPQTASPTNGNALSIRLNAVPAP
ncbi:MAG: hypothetical protein H7066_12545 [Cytophagaceae bacterium]|nr:hypothetical protein [Gemmatimonadaceae bacterium]